jgi:hypothetical protein
MSRVLLAAVAAALLTSPALAQPACDQAGDVVALSNIVLARRADLPRLQARNFGAEAAFLKIRYEPLDDDRAEALVNSPDLAEVRNIKDLVFALAVRNRNLSGANQTLGTDEFQKLILASPTTVRALILRGAEDVVINALPASPGDVDYSSTLPLFAAVLDLPDETKQRIAALAEAKGQIVAAGAIYAVVRDPEAWPDFLSRIPSADLRQAIARLWDTLPSFVGNAHLADPDDYSPQTTADLHSVVAGAVLQPEYEFLNPFLNQTGYIDYALVGAGAVRRGLADGSISPKGPMDAGWIATYRAMTADGVREIAAGLADTLTGNNMGQRPLRRTSAEVLDWMLAVDALRPYIRGETDKLPAAPVGPSGSIAQWSEWQVLAEYATSASGISGVNNDDLSTAMLAELLFAAERYEDLGALLANAPPTPVTVGLAADFAQRLDRLCAAYLWHPAESVLLNGQPIYKFDDAGADFAYGPADPAAAADEKGSAKN